VTKFAIEVAKESGHGTGQFFDADEYHLLLSLYGSLRHPQSRD
jgi:hypothetical protein